ncbi:MAG: YncE family protein [Ktedonobacteraceae bacterium]
MQFNPTRLNLKTRKITGSIFIPLVAILLIQSLLLFLFPSISYADGGFPIIGVLHAGSNPEGIAVDTQTHMVYITYEYPSLVVAFDPTKGQVRWQKAVGDTPSDVQVDSTNHHVYVASTLFRSNQGLLAILDGATGKTLLTAAVGPGDNGIAVDTKRQRVYVSSTNNSIINTFRLVTSPDGKLRAEPSTLSFGPRPQAVGVNSHLGRLYVGDAMENTITVYDEDRGRTLATIRVAAVPEQPLRVDEATGRVYVVCSMGQELDVIDGNHNNVLARIPVSPSPEGVAFNTATGRIYVADEGNKDSTSINQTTGTTITVIDGQSFDVLGTLQVGRSPDGVEADPLLSRVYVAVEDSSAVVEISDSVNLPLQAATNFHQAAAAHRAVFLLQQATIITVIIMILTIVAATLGALSPRWRGRGIPQTLPGDASSRLERHIPPQ